MSPDNSPAEKPAATHLRDAEGNIHPEVAAEFTPAHGPNLADRSDTVEDHFTDTQPKPTPEPTSQVERAEQAIPVATRRDQGQNAGSERSGGRY